MKKLLLTLISVTLLFSCGENEKDVKIKELEKKIKEFEENEEDNVLKEEIALKEVNLGIVRIISSLEKRNNETYHAFDNATNQEKVKPYKDLVYQIKPEADELIDFIQGMKNEEIYNSGEATQLRNDINDYKEFLLNILETSKDEGLVSDNGYLSSLIEELNTTLDIKDGEIYEEDDISDLVDLTLLSKWQADIRNMESSVIRFLAANIDASSIKFTSAEATTIASSTVILKGDDFTSKIFISAFDNSANPEILIGDYELDENEEPIWDGTPEVIPVENGKGTFTRKGTRVGPQSYKGVIKILKDDGEQYYPFEGEYLVADKSYTVTPTQMNILYANDIDNPIKISVAGYQPEDIKVSFSGGVLTSVNRKKGEYIIKPSQSNVGKEVSVSVAVKKKDGKTQLIGTSVFRVEKLGKQSIIPRYNDGTYTKNKVKANTFSSKIIGFRFPIRFSVSEFTVVCIGSKRVETKVKGYKLSEAAKAEISKLTKGQTVLFKDFVVRQKGVPTYLDRPSDKFELIIE